MHRLSFPRQQGDEAAAQPESFAQEGYQGGWALEMEHTVWVPVPVRPLQGTV